MSNQKLLRVQWNEKESANYYVDKDEYSKAHEFHDHFSLDSFCGVYRFHKANGQVTLFDGVRVREVKVIDWQIV